MAKEKSPLLIKNISQKLINKPFKCGVTYEDAYNYTNQIVFKGTNTHNSVS